MQENQNVKVLKIEVEVKDPSNFFSEKLESKMKKQEIKEIS